MSAPLLPPFHVTLPSPLLPSPSNCFHPSRGPALSLLSSPSFLPLLLHLYSSSSPHQPLLYCFSDIYVPCPFPCSLIFLSFPIIYSSVAPANLLALPSSLPLPLPSSPTPFLLGFYLFFTASFLRLPPGRSPLIFFLPASPFHFFLFISLSTFHYFSSFESFRLLHIRFLSFVFPPVRFFFSL